MLKRFLFFICALLTCLGACTAVPVLADDLSEGLQLYRAKKYQEAIPYLERAANDGNDKAIEALDQIYAKESKVSNKALNNKKNEIPPVSNAQNAPSEEATSDETAKNNFLRKVIAISVAIGFVAGWIIYRKFLRKPKNQQQNSQDNKTKS